MIGKQILHYRILKKLGEGGMGVVYLAEDTKLKRQVAIKFLPPHISKNSDERKRFEIEAQAAAALNHPNIATIHAIEHSDDDVFIVMEYIEGKELKQVLEEAKGQRPNGKSITANGLLPADYCLDIAAQIASGLQAAHKKGIVHRDIKSSNIMITDEGQVKIMDFGLAKLRGGADLTRAGTTVGTVSYMSPEQARGEVIDQRSDIWSFGVLLYELITCQRPFRGDYEQAVIYCIINEKFEPLSSFRPDIPAGLEPVMAKLLAKEVKDRYQQIEGVTDDLKKLSGTSSAGTSTMQNSGSVPASRKSKIMPLALTALIAVLVMIMAYVLFSGKPDIESLAVLPFVNTSEDPDANYLSDGVTASLINRLSELSELKVMSRHSVVRFKDQDRDPLAAGRQLEVESVLAGQMGIRGDDLVVTVELLNVKDGRQLWGDRFERSRKEILSVEHEIVERISGKLKKRYSRNEDQQKAIGADPMAYDLYLRGRYIMLGTSDDGPARAQEYFRQAIEKDPRLAVAYAGLGASYVTQTWLNSRKSGEMIPLAKAALDKAMELDDRLSEAYVLKGEIALVYEWDWAAARSAYQKAIELNPGSDLAHREYSSFLLVMGEIEEAIAESRLAQSLDPLSVYATHQMGYNLLAAGRLAEAATEFKKAIDLNPSWIWGNIKLGMSYAHMGEHEKALAALHRADELLAGKTPSPLAQSWMAEIAYLSGETERAKATLANLENMAKTTYVDPFTMAGLYFVTGDSDKFFSELERGMETRAPHMFTLLLHSKYFWKSAAGDPRYKSFLERLKFPGI